MEELDQMWSQMLEEATASARTSGRHDVADYLDLKARNDVLRSAGVRWLIEGLIAVAGEVTRRSTVITIDREDPHNFDHRGANIAGSLLKFRHGVRCLTLEAGWTRTPADGFMRGGALAIAKLTHFGMPKMNAELHLKPGPDRPRWVAFYADGASIDADETFLKQHFAILIGD
jgi:hypothetical protein